MAEPLMAIEMEISAALVAFEGGTLLFTCGIEPIIIV